jgi:hypothetical protein
MTSERLNWQGKDGNSTVYLYDGIIKTMNIFQYILQGIAHEIVLFFNFIDYSWFFFVALGIILVFGCFKSLSNNLLNFLSALLNIVKIPIVLIGILLVLGMYILTAYKFDDSISFYFVLITLISFIKDIIDFYKDFNSDISLKILIKTSFSLAKGAFLLLFVRIVNIIDIWDFKNLKYIYVYLIYLFALLILTFIKKVYIIIDEHRCRCHIKGGSYNRIILFLLYCYAVFYIKNLDISSNMLFAFYNHERTSTLIADMKKVRKQSLKIREIMKQHEIDKPLLKRIGVDNYEQEIPKNI